MAPPSFSRSQAYRPGDEIVPGYVLVRRIGGGGFGDVWEAQAPGRIRVAVKVIEGLSGVAGGKEFRGLMVVKGVSHPNLCQISAFWLKDEHGRVLTDAECESVLSTGTRQPMAGASFSRPQQLIIAMQLGDESLFDRLHACQQEQQDGIPVQELLSYLEDASKAIDLLNGKYKIQHCDIKPQNILLLNGAPLVCDFGLARSLDDLRRSTTLTYSPAYGAPELYDGHETSATDQYSLAISYVELRTGRLPFANETPTAVMKAKITGDLDLSRLPERERSVIERATALDPAARFSSCREMVKALLRAVESVPTTEDEIVPGFKLVREIGAGAYGTVWEGLAPGEIPVAIKILEMEESAGRMEFRGLQSIKNINHPNLCPIFGIWLKDEYGRILERSEGAAFALETVGDVPAARGPMSGTSQGGTDRLGHSDTDAGAAAPAAAGASLGGTLQPGSARPTPRSDRASDGDHAPDAPRRQSHVRLLVAMSLAESSLAQRLQETLTTARPGLPRQELLGYVQDAAKAIDFLNCDHGMRHGDVKPANMLLAGHSVQVCDFGLAQPLGKTTSRVLCTPAYAAPEIHAGASSETSDLYSLAISYYELRTGRLPYRDGTTEEDLRGIKAQHALELDALPRRVRGVIHRATSPQRDQRYATCKEMVQAIADAESRRRMPLVAFALAVLVLAAAATPLVWNLWRRAALYDRWSSVMASKVYADAITLIPQFPGSEQDARWRAVQEAVTEEATGFARSAAWGERLQALGVYDRGAALFTARPEVAAELAASRDALATELLARAREPFARGAYAEAADPLTRLAEQLTRLKISAGSALEQPCREAWILAASALFFAADGPREPTRAPWEEIDRRLRAVPRPAALDPREELGARFHCLLIQQARSATPSGTLTDAAVLDPLARLVAAAPPETTLREYGVTELIGQARDAVILADDATVARAARPIDRIWPGLTEIRDQLRRAAEAAAREEWTTAAQLLDKADALRQERYATVPGLELVIVLRRVELATRRPDAPLTAADWTAYLEVIARCGAGNELFASSEQILANLERRVLQGLAVGELTKPRAFLDTPALGERLSPDQLAALRGRALRLEVLGQLCQRDPLGLELAEQCQQLRQMSAASAVTDAAYVEAKLAAADVVGGTPLSAVELAGLVTLADAAHESAARDPTVTGLTFAGYPAYVRAATILGRSAAGVGDPQVAHLLAEALAATRQACAASPPLVPVLTHPSRVARCVAALVAAAESRGALPHDTFLPAALDSAGLAAASDLLRSAAAWLDLAHGALETDPLLARLTTWRAIASAFAHPWPAPEAARTDWRQVAADLDHLPASEGTGPIATAHTRQLVRGLAHAALVRAGASEGQRASAWPALAEALEGFQGLRRTQGANISPLAIYNWIIQPALAIDPAPEDPSALDAVPPAAQHALANLYIAEANLLQVPGEVRSSLAGQGEAPSADAAAEAAYRRAEQLLARDATTPNPLLAETRVQQFYLRLRMMSAAGNAAVEELGDLVARAREADPQYPSAIGVSAHWNHERSRLAATRDERARGLQNALAEYTEAVKLEEALEVSAGRRDAYQRDLRLLCEGRSAAELEAAFYAKDRRDEREALLAAALHDAARALQIDDDLVPAPHDAYIKLGNALEDHAYYLQDTPLPADEGLARVLADRVGFTLDDTTRAQPGAWRALKFAAADAAFAKALEHTSTVDQRAFAQLCRGRARYRSALSPLPQDRAGAEQSLRAAHDDLADAVSDAALQDPRYRAEAFHWLGEVLEVSQEYAEAIKCYQSATHLAKEGGAPEWPDYQLAWADLLSQQDSDNQDATDPRLKQAYDLAEEVLHQTPVLTREGVQTLELLANCKGRRQERDQVAFIERYLPATPPTDAEALRSYWQLQHLRSWWAYYRVADRARYVAERAQARAVRDGCRACGDPTLAAHGEGIYGLWTWKWVRALGVGAPERPPATQEAFDALAQAVETLRDAGEYRVYTADYANALAELYKATGAAAPLQTRFRAVVQPLRDALVQHPTATRQLFKETLFDDLLQK